MHIICHQRESLASQRQCSPCAVSFIPEDVSLIGAGCAAVPVNNDSETVWFYGIETYGPDAPDPISP
jgi:hypothetical protein